MRSSLMPVAAHRMHEALQELQLAWAHVREDWTDAQAVAFEENHLRHIAEELGMALPAISKTAQLFDQAQRECEDVR